MKETDIEPYRLRPTDIVCGRNSLLANKRRTNQSLLRRLYNNQHSASYPYSYQYSPCVRRPNCRFEHPLPDRSSHFNPNARPVPDTNPVSDSRNPNDNPNAPPRHPQTKT